MFPPGEQYGVARDLRIWQPYFGDGRRDSFHKLRAKDEIEGGSTVYWAGVAEGMRIRKRRGHEIIDMTTRRGAGISQPCLD